MKFIRIIKIYFAIVYMLLSCSCSKELDIKYHLIDPLTVIEGELTPEGIKVGITLTTPMGESMDRTLLTDATVMLIDLTEDINYELTTDSENFYINGIPGIIGHNYRLHVERKGEVYEMSTIMFPSVEITGVEFNWIKMPYDHVAVLQVQFIDPMESADYFWVKIYRNGKIYQWNQISDKGSLDGIITFLTMTSRMDTDEEDDEDVLYDGDLINISISAISREMYDYLEALQNDSSGPAMFSGDKCLGYFMATSPMAVSTIFHPDEIPMYK